MIDFDYLRVGIGLLLSFVVTYISIPSIVRVSRVKKLFDEPIARSVHHESTPTLGGLAIFAGFVLGISLTIDVTVLCSFQYFIAALLIIFFIGIKDDILVIAPITKLSGQIVASLIITILGDIRLTDLHAFWQIRELPFGVSVLLTVFVILVITNGINLIDGIDGLASLIGAIVSVSFGVWFLLVEQYEYAIVAFALVGGLIAFWIYNVYGTTNKIFMGDTGSLVIGLIISTLVIWFNEVNLDTEQAYYVQSAPSVSFGILIVPLGDMLRVMLVRLMRGRSMFKADKNHMHHQLLRLRIPQRRVMWTMALVNVLFVLFVFTINRYISIRRMMLLILVIAMILSYVPPIILWLRKKKARKYKNR